MQLHSLCQPITSSITHAVMALTPSPLPAPGCGAVPSGRAAPHRRQAGPLTGGGVLPHEVHQQPEVRGGSSSVCRKWPPPCCWHCPGACAAMSTTCPHICPGACAAMSTTCPHICPGACAAMSTTCPHMCATCASERSHAVHPAAAAAAAAHRHAHRHAHAAACHAANVCLTGTRVHL